MNSNLIKVVLISRFFQEDEEMLVLTHRDELNITYSEDNRAPLDTIATKNKTGCDDPRRAARAFLTERDDPRVWEKTASDLVRADGDSREDSPAFEQTRASVLSSGTSTSAITSADSLWCTNTGQFSKARRSSEKPSCNQNQGNRRKTHRWTGELGGNVQAHSLLEDEGDREDGEDSEAGTSQSCTSLEEERVISANVVHNPNTGTPGLNPAATITAWEAGWNVTNAIQVSDVSHTHKKREKIDIRRSSDVEYSFLNPRYPCQVLLSVSFNSKGDVWVDGSVHSMRDSCHPLVLEV